MNRQPAVAGTFYPANSQQLQQLVNCLLDDAKNQSLAPKAIIAPHAGLIYSGAIAASAYSRLLQAYDTITRVILIGPSHRVSFNGLAISKAESFSTPLGEITVDITAVNKITSLPFVNYY